jgi:hypothetical protein
MQSKDINTHHVPPRLLVRESGTDRTVNGRDMKGNVWSDPFDELRQFVGTPQIELSIGEAWLRRYTSAFRTSPDADNRNPPAQQGLCQIASILAIYPED